MIWEESVSVGWVGVDSLAESERVYPIYRDSMLYFVIPGPCRSGGYAAFARAKCLLGVKIVPLPFQG